MINKIPHWNLFGYIWKWFLTEFTNPSIFVEMSNNSPTMLGLRGLRSNPGEKHPPNPRWTHQGLNLVSRTHCPQNRCQGRDGLLKHGLVYLVSSRACSTPGEGQPPQTQKISESAKSLHNVHFLLFCFQNTLIGDSSGKLSPYKTQTSHHKTQPRTRKTPRKAPQHPGGLANGSKWNLHSIFGGKHPEKKLFFDSYFW